MPLADAWSMPMVCTMYSVSKFMTQAVPRANAAKATMATQHDRLLKPSDTFGFSAFGPDS